LLLYVGKVGRGGIAMGLLCLMLRKKGEMQMEIEVDMEMEMSGRRRVPRAAYITYLPSFLAVPARQM
jgi:hypothetical protein